MPFRGMARPYDGPARRDGRDGTAATTADAGSTAGWERGLAHETPPRWDRAMRRRLREGEAAALAELYDRFATLAYGIAQRVLGDEEATERVTLEVFRRIWESPEEFDAEPGPTRSWIAAEAHRQSVALLGGQRGGEAPEEHRARLRDASTAARADYIVTAMPAPLREALGLARFQRRDYREVAAHLGIAEAEARRRLRLGLQLLATAADYPPEASGAPAPAPEERRAPRRAPEDGPETESGR